MSPYHGGGWWKQCIVLGGLGGGGVVVVLISGVESLCGKSLTELTCADFGIIFLVFCILTAIAVKMNFKTLEMISSLTAGAVGLVFLNSLIIHLCGINSYIFFGVEHIIVGIVCISLTLLNW